MTTSPNKRKFSRLIDSTNPSGSISCTDAGLSNSNNEPIPFHTNKKSNSKPPIKQNLYRDGSLYPLGYDSPGSPFSMLDSHMWPVRTDYPKVVRDEDLFEDLFEEDDDEEPSPTKGKHRELGAPIPMFKLENEIRSKLPEGQLENIFISMIPERIFSMLALPPHDQPIDTRTDSSLEKGRVSFQPPEELQNQVKNIIPSFSDSRCSYLYPSGPVADAFESLLPNRWLLQALRPMGLGDRERLLSLTFSYKELTILQLLRLASILDFGLPWDHDRYQWTNNFLLERQLLWNPDAKREYLGWFRSGWDWKPHRALVRKGTVRQFPRGEDITVIRSYQNIGAVNWKYLSLFHDERMQEAAAEDETAKLPLTRDYPPIIPSISPTIPSISPLPSPALSYCENWAAFPESAVLDQSIKVEIYR